MSNTASLRMRIGVVMDRAGVCIDCARHNRVTGSARTCPACRLLAAIEPIYGAVAKAKKQGKICNDPTRDQLLRIVVPLWGRLGPTERHSQNAQLQAEGFVDASMEALLDYARRVAQTPPALIRQRTMRDQSASPYCRDEGDLTGLEAQREQERRERRAREESFTEHPGRRLSQRDPLRERPHGDPVADWTKAARALLAETAQRYNRVIYYGAFVELVQARAKVWGHGHSTGMHATLYQLTKECIDSGEPILSTLCVNDDGTVAGGYAKAIAESRGAVTNLEQMAADDRLACYRCSGAEGLPKDGGSPVSSADLARRKPMPLDAKTRWQSITAARAGVLIRQMDDPAKRWDVVRRLIQEAGRFRGLVDELIREEPEEVGDPRFDAALAAAAELIATRWCVAVPRWAGDKRRFLDSGWWVSDPDPESRAAALISTPASFRRRGLLVSSTELRWAAKDCRVFAAGPWSASAAQALTRLHDELARMGVSGQVYAIDAQQAAIVACAVEDPAVKLTDDNVACVFRGAGKVSGIALRVAQEMKLSDKWLEELTFNYTRSTERSAGEYLLDLPYLQLSSSALDRVLALCVLAAQGVDDVPVIRVLAAKLQLGSPEQVWKLVHRFYPGVGPLDRSRDAVAHLFD